MFYSIICNTEKMETVKMFNNRRLMKIDDVVHSSKMITERTIKDTGNAENIALSGKNDVKL
jgi:hypothetical protein